jgi:hypothetical protein
MIGRFRFFLKVGAFGLSKIFGTKQTSGRGRGGRDSADRMFVGRRT